MKKRFSFLPYLPGLLLCIALSACSYQTIQPEEVQPEQVEQEIQEEKEEQENLLSENKPAKKQSSTEKNLSQESEKANKEIEIVNKEPEQERYSTEKPLKKTSEQASESASQLENKEQENKMQESEEQENQQQKNKLQKNKQADAQAETTDSQASPLIILPEELDDGSKGELPNSSNDALISDQEKAGNSNINRKGGDTYSREEGKPKRIWNLQRQL